MRGLDIIGADPALGLSWGDVGDVGKAAFPYIHATGKGIASAFGAGAAADALEHVEQGQGWLPATPAPMAATVSTTAQNIASVATPKLHPPTKSASTAATGGKPAKGQAQHGASAQSSTGKWVIGAALVGVVVLLLRRLLSR